MAAAIVLDSPAVTMVTPDAGAAGSLSLPPSLVSLETAVRVRSSGHHSWSVPSLVAHELVNVLRYETDLAADQIEEALQRLFDVGLDWVVPSSATMRRAVEIARTH